MGKKSKYFAVILLVAVFCLSFAVVSIANNAGMTKAEDNLNASQTSFSTVAMHDPSIVVAYEDENGNTYGEQNAEKTLTKVYFVFATQIGNAKSYDLVNWTSFTNNMNNVQNLYDMLGDSAVYSQMNTIANDNRNAISNSWAPDVIWNKDLKKWCMYLSVNGPDHNSSIVMLMADNLNGNWSKVDTVVWSGFTSSNIGYTDYEKVMGTTSINAYHNIVDSSGFISYAPHAIDPSVFYDEDGQLWMTYGSWRGGIFLLKLDNYTGVRDYGYTYETVVKGTPANGSSSFTVTSDKYFGKHIAGGAGSTGEGPYIEYMNGYYYLFVSYGGYAPSDGYNMRYFRSSTVDGDYVDANGDSALYDHEKDNNTTFGTYGTNGIRVMSGYTWSWWNYSYVAQGHNSVFVDDDGKMYVVYHNKYTDGTDHHVMKVHELIDVGNGWLAAAPFEAIKESDSLLNSSVAESSIEGTYGAFVMTNTNGTYDNVCKESQIVLNSDKTVSGAMSGSWNFAYDQVTNDYQIQITVGGKTYTGKLLNQTLEGTNIKTVSITALNTSGGETETLWAYKYPSEITAGAYARASVAVPETANLDMLTSSFSNVDNIWYNTTVTMTKNGTGYSGSDGSSISIANTSEYYAQYANVGYGQSFLAMPNVSGGFSISFDYGNYSSDWTRVFTGSNSRVYLSVLEYDTSNTNVAIFEASAVAAQYKEFAENPWEAFYTTGTARATISVNSDYSISFYRDGIKMFTYSKGTTFNNSAYTIADLGMSLENDIKNGTLTSNYAISNVVIGAPIGQPNASAMDITLTNASLLYSAADNTAYNAFVPAISNAASNGVAVSFYLSSPIGFVEEADWNAVLISNVSVFKNKIALPNLDTSDYKIRKWPEEINLVNAGAYSAFLNTVGFVTVSVNSDGTVVYYMNGVKMVSYNSGDTCSGDYGGSVGSFVSNLLSGIAGNGFYFANGVSGARDLIVTNGLNDSQAIQVYKDYKEYAPWNFEERDYNYGDSGINVIYAPTATYSTSAFLPVTNAVSSGVAVSFQQNAQIPDKNDTGNNDWPCYVIISNRIKITMPNLDPFQYQGGNGIGETNKWPGEGNFYNGGAWNSFLNNETYYATVSINTDGSIVYYKNGVKMIAYSASETLNNGTPISTFVSVVLQEIQNNGFGFGNVMFSAKDVTVTNAVSDAQALTLYENRNTVSEDHDCSAEGHSYVLSETKGSVCEGFTLVYACQYCGDSYEVASTEGVVGHKYELVTYNDSTCALEGIATYRCSVCGDEVSAVIPLKDHTPGEWVYDETYDGTTGRPGHWQICSECGAEINYSEGHSYSAEQILKEATCEHAGLKQKVCTLCGYVKQEVIPQKQHTSTGEWQGNDDTHWKDCDICGQPVVDYGAHSYGEWETVTPATCHSNGEEQRVCSVCGYVMKRTIYSSTVPHNMSTTWSYDDDYHYLVCTNEGCTYTDEKTAHVWSETGRDEPGCTTQGTIYYSCECGAEKTEPIPAEGHSYTSVVVGYSDDMTSPWSTQVTCDKGCGESLDLVDIPALTEGWTLDTEDGNYVAPTHTQDGKGTYYRTVEQDGYSVEVRVTDVTIKTNAEHVYPTEISFDNSDYVAGEYKAYCTFGGCTSYVTVQLPEFTAAGWSETVDLPATCETKGSKTLSRSVEASSGQQIVVKVKGVEIGLAAHTLTHVEATGATCDRNGNVEYWQCSVCGKKFADASGAVEVDDVVIPAKGHSYTSVTVDYSDKMASSWSVKVVCDNGCGTDLTIEAIPAIGDAGWTLDSETSVAPTHTQNGKADYYRTVEQDGYSVVVRVENYVLKANSEHEYAQILAFNAKDYVAGQTTVNCTYGGCDASITVELPELTADGWTESDVVAATCTQAGSKTLAREITVESDTITVIVREVEIAATGHNYVFDKTVEPDFGKETDGYDLYVCENDPSHTEQRNFVEWETLGATLVFDTNGAGSIASKFVEKGTSVKLTTPSRSGYTFGGWYTEDTFENKVGSSFVVNENATLYARWLINVIETDDDQDVEIKVENPDGFDEDVRITVVDKTDESKISVEDGKVDKVYEVTVNTTITGEVTVSIYVGEDFDSETSTLYIADAQGELTQVEYEYVDGYVTLGTTELGTFVFASPADESGVTTVPGNDAALAITIVCIVISVAAIAAVVVAAVVKKKRRAV